MRVRLRIGHTTRDSIINIRPATVHNIRTQAATNTAVNTHTHTNIHIRQHIPQASIRTRRRRQTSDIPRPAAAAITTIPIRVTLRTIPIQVTLRTIRSHQVRTRPVIRHEHLL